MNPKPNTFTAQTPIEAPIKDASQILSPEPRAEFRVGSTIPLKYKVQVVGAPGPDLPPTVNVLLHKVGLDYSVEIATNLPTSGPGANVKDGVLSFDINLKGFWPAFEAGEYKLITVQHNVQAIKVHDGSLATRQVTGDQLLFLLPDITLGPGPEVPPGQK